MNLPPHLRNGNDLSNFLIYDGPVGSGLPSLGLGFITGTGIITGIKGRH